MTKIDSLEPRRLLAAGAVDPTFGGGDGSVDFRTSNHDWASAGGDIAVDDSGRTVIASLYRTHQQISLTRLLPDGSVDTSFGTDGIATMDTGFDNRARGSFQVTVDHAGKVLVMFKNRLTRLYESGSVDKLFGSKGSITMPMFSDVADVAIDAKNRPVVIGTSQGKTGTRGTVVRFGLRGVVDGSFGSNGLYKTPVPTYQNTKNTGNATGAALKMLSDGRVIGVTKFVAPRSPEETYTGESGVLTFRLNVNGALETNYGKNGFTRQSDFYAEYTFAGSSFEAFGPDGSVIVGNNYHQDSGGGDYLEKTWSKIDKNGALGGAAFEGLVDNLERDDDTTLFPTYYTHVVAVQPDSKLLVRYSDSVVRFNAKFTRDIKFPEITLPAASGTLVIDNHRVLVFSSVQVGDQAVRSALRVTAIEI